MLITDTLTKRKLPSTCTFLHTTRHLHVCIGNGCEVDGLKFSSSHDTVLCPWEWDPKPPLTPRPAFVTKQPSLSNTPPPITSHHTHTHSPLLHPGINRQTTQTTTRRQTGRHHETLPTAGLQPQNCISI